MSEGGANGRPAFWTTPPALRVHLLVVGAAALTLPFALAGLGPDEVRPQWLAAAVLVVVSVLNVEFSRALSGGLSHSDQPHKALSAWAFATALLLPTPWLLLVVPITYTHARWRGLRLPLWKWVGSAAYLVVSGLAAAAVRHLLMPDQANWMRGDGGRGLATMLLAAAAFLLVETLLFAGSAVLNRADDEVWLRKTLRSPSFYRTEAAVLLIGGLLAALWTGGAWYIVLLIPIYALAQRAALHEPLRERAESAAQLAAANRDLEAANAFKVDLMGMLGHEIGNPLTAIQGYAQVGAEALAADDDDLAARSIEVIATNSTRIRTVLHEILTTVTSDGGSLTARPRPCLLEPHLLLAAGTQPSGRQPVVECPPDLAALVQPEHLDQMLANLVSNAAKYGGGATCLRAAALPATQHVEIEVTDRGPGVPRTFEERLFQRFSRSADTAGHVVGTGLGLFITRELARANGADVRYRRGRAEGATFVLTLRTVAGDPPA